VYDKGTTREIKTNTLKVVLVIKNNNMAKRVRRSEKLTPEEHQQFLQFMEGFELKVEVEEKLKLSRATLDRVSLSGSGKPETIKRIRKQLA